MERLQKYIASCGVASRRKAEELITEGKVQVNGRKVTELGMKINPQKDKVKVNGQLLAQEKPVYYLLNKPKGVITATTDSQLPTVIDLFKNENIEGLYPIGRLDRDTEGLLIITNNGPLGYRLLNPIQHIEKEYYVEVNGPLDDSCIQRFYDGIIFHDGTICKPAKLSILESSPSFSKATVIISEGKFHQIKKMFLCVGVKVIFLKRIRFGEFLLDESLSPGEYRPLNFSELQILKQYF